MIRCCIYVRVSSEEQAGPDKTSIQTQLTDCRALAAKLGWLVVAEYVDDKRYRVGKRMVEPSGTRADRPAWRRMLAELESGRADAVLGWHSTRLWRGYRPFIDFLEIVEARNIQVQLVKDSFDRRFAILQAWLGQQENSARVERTRFGHIGRARRGLATTRTTAYYKPYLDPATGRPLGYEFNESYRASFDRLAALFLAHYSYREIARRLGTNPHTGKPWVHRTIADIMDNPYYRGLVQFGRRNSKEQSGFTVKGLQRAVWDETTCAAIETELARRQATGSHAPRSHSAPLAGVLYCGYCGHLLSPTTPGKSRRDGRPVRSYACYHNRLVRNGYAPGTPHPPNQISEVCMLRLLQAEINGIDETDVDDIVTLLASRAPAAPADDGLTRAELAEAERQIAELEPELGRVRSALAKAAIDAELTNLRSQAALYREHLASRSQAGTVDLAAMRRALLALSACPDLLAMPLDDLRELAALAFPRLHIAHGEIVPAPNL